MMEKEKGNRGLLDECIAFHGHLCPGLALGYQAAVAGMGYLSVIRAEDEEMVAIVETDACCADAVQVITGCTFGKGNFLFRDYGKMAFTFINRNTGQGVRLARKHDENAGLDPNHMALLGKVINDRATDEEKKIFWDMHQAKSLEILDQDPKELFLFSEITEPLPEKAKIEPSIPCGRCGEPTMASKLEEKDGQSVCRGCLA